MQLCFQPCSAFRCLQYSNFLELQETESHYITNLTWLACAGTNWKRVSYFSPSDHSWLCYRREIHWPTIQVWYRIAGNFREHKFSRESPTNTPGKKFRDFYFRDKVTISDHTPYNFPHSNGDPQHEFQRQNDSKTLARLSKCVGRCRQRTAMPKGGS